MEKRFGNSMVDIPRTLRKDLSYLGALFGLYRSGDDVQRTDLEKEMVDVSERMSLLYNHLNFVGGTA